MSALDVYGTRLGGGRGDRTLPWLVRVGAFCELQTHNTHHTSPNDIHLQQKATKMPSIKGTASISSTHALSKLLRTTNFPSHFSTKVDISKIHRGVLSHWINQRITEILGFEDEIVSEMATNLFLPEETEGSTNNNTVEIDPRKAQLDLVGFLGEKESAEFANELWEMMIDGSQRKSGIPLVLVQKKKEEMARAREEQRFGGQRGIERHEPARRYAGGASGR